MKFPDLLAALGLTPKTLTEARGTLDASKATLASVVEMFSVAGLDLDTLLAAGPDALKAHLASLDNAAQVATLTADLATAKDRLVKLDEETVALSDTLQHITTAIELPMAKDAKLADVKTAFADHVAKATTLALAKTGHPPVHHIDASAPVATAGDQAAADEAHLVAYEALTDGDLRFAYYDKHDAALHRAAARRKAAAS